MNKTTVRGIEMAYVDRGSGTPVLLVHGFPLDHTMWNAQIDALANDNCRVIAPDLRGFGQTEAEEGTVTMDDMADDLAELLDRLEIDEPVVLCGLSMGGYVAFAFWRKYADRLRGLILTDTRAIADSPEVAAGRLTTAKEVENVGPANLAASMMPKLFAKTSLEKIPNEIEALRKVVLGNNRTGIAAAARGMAQRPDMTGELAEIDCPTLVVVGTALDAISTPKEMRAIADGIPNAQFVEISGSGHMSPMENHEEFNAAVAEFIRRS